MLTLAQMQFYQENGYVVIPAVFSSDEIKTLSDSTEKLALEAKKFHVTNSEQQFEELRGTQVVLAHTKDNQVAIKRLVWAAAADPSLLKIGRDERVLKLAFSILQTDEADHLINQVHLKEPHDGVSFPWHQDEQNRRKFDPDWQDCGENGSFVQIIVAIDPCTTENGPLLVIPGSHHWGYLKFDAFLTNEQLDERFMSVRGLKVESAQVPLLMQPGDAVLMHPRLIHGSWPNESPVPRRVFLNGFSSPEANHRQYPGVGSAKRISLIDGSEIDLKMRASINALIESRSGLSKVKTPEPQSQPSLPLTTTFH